MVLIVLFRLAVKYLFLTNDGLEEHPELNLEPFNATSEQNDYEVRIYTLVQIRDLTEYDRFHGHCAI